MYQRIEVLLFLIFGSLLTLGTPAELSAEQAKHTYRVLGLFQADREDDLRHVVAKISGLELVEVDFEDGSATFDFDPAELLPNRKTPEQWIEGLDQRLRQESRSTFELMPLSGVDRAELERIEIEILGLDCKGCSYAAYLAVYKIDGVENATASFHDRKLVAWIDPAKTNRQSLIEALEKKTITIGDR